MKKDAHPGSEALKRATTNGDFTFKIKSRAFHNDLGSGKSLVVSCIDRRKTIDLEVHLGAYHQFPAVIAEVFCKNVSSDDITVHSIEPVRIHPREGGSLHVPGIAKCLTNGQMYFDAGSIHQFGTSDGGISSGQLKGVTLANGTFDTGAETIHSWWNAGLFSSYEKAAMAVGYLENTHCLGNLLMTKTSEDMIALVAESVFPPGVTLRPGQTLRSNRVILITGPTPYAALEQYAGLVGKVNNARTGSILNGWCSWFYTLAQVSEAEVMANTALAAEYLKAYGLEYIQVDEGYQRWHGDWRGNERFPNGMRWLADQIKGHGFKAGIWISPYVISEPTDVFREHPDWLVHRRDGTLQRVGNWPTGAEQPADENPKRYCLDITHPDAARWLHDLIHMIANDWGYELIKIDFVAWSILAAERYHDPAVSSAEVYRKGMEIMRKAAGDKCHILECGPGATTVGLVDSMRIELDVNYGFFETAWDTYFLNPASSMSATGKRYYFHRRTWINDADHLCMDLLNHRQSQAAATLIAMSGGNTISGDRLTQLNPEKLDILRKILPSSGVAARPVDLFDGDNHSVFAARMKKKFGEWTVAAFFNASLTEDVEREFPLQRLWLEPDKSYLAFDFWSREYLGEITGSIRVNIPAAAVRLLTLHEKTEHPQFLSTDRHVSQGAIEIENVEWDENTKTLSGTSIGPLHSSHNVFVYVPGEHPWTWGGYVLFHDEESYSLKLVQNNIIRVHVSFDTGEKVNWKINVDKFFNRQ